METTKLYHLININDSLVNCQIKIQLADDCKNGHQDFSITATFWEVGKVRADKNMTFGGCCHDEILKVRPELEIFVKLHLCDFNGVPMHATANGFYHLTKGFERLNGKTQKEYFCDYYRISNEKYDILKTAENEKHFGYLLVKLGVLDNWKKEAIEAIKLLENLTQNKFVNNSTKQNFRLTNEEIEQIENLDNSGYYSLELIEKRKQEKKEAKKNELLSKLLEKRNKELRESEIRYLVSKAAIELFLTDSNIIYYTHTEEIVFNWSNSAYEKKWSQNEFNKIVNKFKRNYKFDSVKFKLN